MLPIHQHLDQVVVEHLEMLCLSEEFLREHEEFAVVVLEIAKEYPTALHICRV